MFGIGYHGLLKAGAPIALLTAMLPAPSHARTDIGIEQVGPDAMLERYKRASVLANRARYRYALNRYVIPTWFGTQDRFWFCNETKKGCRYLVVDARTGRAERLFDQEDLASKLTKLLGRAFSSEDLQLSSLTVTADKQIEFSVSNSRFSYQSGGDLERLGSAPAVPSVVSPDGSREAFVEDWNIWVRDLKTGAERQVTSDGQADNSYGLKPTASRNFQWAAEVKWAPDSIRLLTVQTDDRRVQKIPLIEYARNDSVRPKAFDVPYAFPGDEHVPTFRMLIVNTETTRQTNIQYPVLAATRMLDAPPQGGRAWWSGDGSKIFFVDIERGEKLAKLITASAATGEARELMRESNRDGYVELAEDVYGAATTFLLASRNQLIWYSERSGVPQLYLYNLANGKLIRALTSREYAVRSLLHVDEARGEAWVAISGRSGQKNPYYQEIMRIDLATGRGKIISQGDDDRFVAPDGRNGPSMWLLNARGGSGISPTGNFFVETRMRADRPGVSVVRGRDGHEVGIFSHGTVTGLPATFQWPEPTLAKAADGKTDLQAAIVRPSDFDPRKKYPVIDVIYGTPQATAAPTTLGGGAVTSLWLGELALPLAELGFIVVVIDARGTIGRGRNFHEHSYGTAASSLDDHVAVIRELAARHSYMDLDRVGITGFSGGGFMSTRAILRYPDFFKVAVSFSGNHDPRDFWYSWGERYVSPLVGDDYKREANISRVDRLKGKLMLYHGLMDTGVQPGSTFSLAQALIDANKDFDLVVVPRASHEVTGYAERRMWDYFVKNLAGGISPENFHLENSNDYYALDTRRDN